MVFETLYSNWTSGLITIIIGALLLVAFLVNTLKVRALAKLDFGGKLIGAIVGKGKKDMIGIIAIGILLVAGGVFGSLGGLFSTQSAGNIDDTALAFTCPDTGLVEFDARAVDRASSTLSYVGAMDFYVAGGNQFATGTTRSTSPGYDGNVSVPCSNNYMVYLLTERDSATGAAAQTVTPSNANPQVSFDVKSTDGLQFRVLDNTEGASGYEYVFDNAATSGTNASSTFTASMNRSNVYEDVAGADIAVGADGYLDMQFEIKTDSSNTVFGEDGLRTWMCVDTGTDNEWDVPSVAINGVKLNDAKSSMAPDDLIVSAVAGSEYCYVLPGHIGDTSDRIDFYIKARSGQNPDTSGDDVSVYFLPEGRYVSSKATDTVKVGSFTDASTPALVHLTQATEYPYFVLNIA